MHISVCVIDEDASVCRYQNLTLDVSHRNHTIKREGMCCLHNAIGIKRKSTFKVNFWNWITIGFIKGGWRCLDSLYIFVDTHPPPPSLYRSPFSPTHIHFYYMYLANRLLSFVSNQWSTNILDVALTKWETIGSSASAYSTTSTHSAEL